MSAIPTLIIGASGYVGGELLRLVDAHPTLELLAAVSDSLSGAPIGETFAHLGSAYPGHRFHSQQDAIAAIKGCQQLAVFSAAPHGGSAQAIERVVNAAQAQGTTINVVDASADFRLTDTDEYERIYGQPHGVPSLLAEFVSAVPEHMAHTSALHVGHPGCFATAMQLAIVPLLAAGITHNQFFTSGVTGSTGSGKLPTATTHSPERHSNLFAYKPLAHRHAPEVIAHADAATGIRPALHFVPHSGPFARGIHMTVHAPLAKTTDSTQLQDMMQAYYANSAFVRVVDGMPRLKNVVASNYADIGVACDNDSVVVCVVIDNLLKGAAGGCMQWMNRLLGQPETTGLTAPAPAWT
ncbi:MAG: N-acetyl-gamma-glutamyl-phosphate reductase [Pseudomonadota bacterium]